MALENICTLVQIKDQYRSPQFLNEHKKRIASDIFPALVYLHFRYLFIMS